MSSRIFFYGLWFFPIILLLEALLRPISEPDIFMYLALAEQKLKTGAFATNDIFSFTQTGQPMMTLHQWLSYISYYKVFSWLGWSGPIFLKALLVSTILAIPLYGLLKLNRLTINKISFYSLLWTITIVAAHHRFRERASLFGDLFLTLLAAGLIWFPKHKIFWLAYPLVFLAWSQLHPSYPLGLVLLGLHFISRRDLDFFRLGCFLLCAVAPLAQPMGLNGYLYPYEFALTIEPVIRQHVMEWLPLWDPRLFSFLFLYLPFVSIIPWLGYTLYRTKAPLFSWVLFSLSMLLMVKSVRFGFFASAWLLILATDALSRAKSEEDAKFISLKAIVPAVLAFALTLSKIYFSPYITTPFAERLKIDEKTFPIKTAKLIEDLHPQLNPQINIFNSFLFGGYLAWFWQGKIPLYFHGFSTNFDFYQTDYADMSLSVADFDRLVNKHRLGLFLLDRNGFDGPLVQLLAKHPRWQLVFDDPASVVFAIKDPGLMNKGSNP